MSDSDITIGSIAQVALVLIDGVPDAVSGAMATYAEMARNKINSILNTSFTVSGISSQYQTPMAELTAMFALGRMGGVGVDYNWSLGEFSVDKKASDRPEYQQIKVLLDDFNTCMRALGTHVYYHKAFS